MTYLPLQMYGKVFYRYDFDFQSKASNILLSSSIPALLASTQLKTFSKHTHSQMHQVGYFLPATDNLPNFDIKTELPHEIITLYGDKAIFLPV